MGRFVPRLAPSVRVRDGRANSDPMSSDQAPAPGGAGYRTTLWTQVIEAARNPDPGAARQALEDFCLGYHDAIRGFLIRKGCSEADGQDLAQEFLYGHVIKDWDEADTIVHRARRESGNRFRSFLSTALIHFLTDRHRARGAEKRGGDKEVSLDQAIDEGAPIEEQPRGDWERQFDRGYARTLLERATQSLRHAEQNLALLTRRKTQAEVAAELGMTENAVKQMHHQFRHRLGAAIRAEVERTVGPDPAEVEAEIRYLMSVFDELE